MYNTIAKLTRQVENWHSIQIVCAVLLCLYVLNGYDTVTAIERSWEMLNGGKRANRNPSMLSAAEQQQAGYIDCRNRISHAPAFMLFFFRFIIFFSSTVSSIDENPIWLIMSQRSTALIAHAQSIQCQCDIKLMQIIIIISVIDLLNESNGCGVGLLRSIACYLLPLTGRIKTSYFNRIGKMVFIHLLTEIFEANFIL